MKKVHLLASSAVCIALCLGWWGHQASAQTLATPKALKGQIITNSKEIQVPATPKNFVKKMRKQDRDMFKRDEEGQWVIYFVAFFNRSLPADQLGIVVLDAKKDPVAVANVEGKKGQKNLASQIMVDSTETPGKKHTIQVFYPKGNKPVILAKKQIVLK
jgi:hypothetical protein